MARFPESYRYTLARKHRDEALAVCDFYEVNPVDVYEIRLTPMTVAFLRYTRDGEGQHYLNAAGNVAHQEPLVMVRTDWQRP